MNLLFTTFAAFFKQANLSTKTFHFIPKWTRPYLHGFFENGPNPRILKWSIATRWHETAQNNRYLFASCTGDDVGDEDSHEIPISNILRKHRTQKKSVIMNWGNGLQCKANYTSNNIRTGLPLIWWLTMLLYVVQYIYFRSTTGFGIGFNTMKQTWFGLRTT